MTTSTKPAFDPSTLKAGDPVYISHVGFRPPTIVARKVATIVARKVARVTATQIVTEERGEYSPARRFYRTGKNAGVELGSDNAWRRATLVSAEDYAKHKKTQEREAKVHQLRATFREAANLPLGEMAAHVEQIQQLLIDLTQDAAAS